VEIEYALAEADIVALARFRVRQKRGLRNPILARRLSYMGGFTLMAVGLGVLTGNAVLSITLLVLAVVSFALYPTFFDWMIRRRVSATCKDPKNAPMLTPRTLSATGDGLEEKSDMGEARLKWAVIGDLTVTPTHAFMSVQNIPSIVIPRDGISQGDFLGFVNACREYIRQGAA
jgi:hypothetical protein